MVPEEPDPDPEPEPAPGANAEIPALSSAVKIDLALLPPPPNKPANIEDNPENKPPKAVCNNAPPLPNAMLIHSIKDAPVPVAKISETESVNAPHSFATSFPYFLGLAGNPTGSDPVPVGDPGMGLPSIAA